MYIHRIITQGVPGLPDRDIVLFDDWANEPLKSVLITGPNGTGKTTLVQIIAYLWESFGDWLRYPNNHPSRKVFHTSLMNSRLAAVEIRGLIEHPLWLYTARTTDDIELLRSQTSNVRRFFFGEAGNSLHDIDITLMDWFKRLASLSERLQIGVTDSQNMLPNIVYIPSDARQIRASNVRGNEPVEPETLHHWLAQYDGAAFTYKDHVEGMLRNLKVRDPNWFYRTLKDINGFLAQNSKQLTDFDNALRLMVQTEGQEGTHYIDKLSSGEQQCLILIFMISRWLTDGGIVLIDEPDLHIHPSWQRQLINEIERLVTQKDGQLIVTSHSPILWEEYNERQRINFEVAIQP